jgi:hypothetical protein
MGIDIFHGYGFGTVKPSGFVPVAISMHAAHCTSLDFGDSCRPACSSATSDDGFFFFVFQHLIYSYLLF